MNGDGASISEQDFASRGLGRRPRLRLVSVLLWSSFLGAALSTVVLLLLPDNWSLPLPTLGGIGITFLLMWLLALVPALFSAVLTAPRSPERQ
ncbi:MAG: hypothetical protein OSA97_10195 [Nevskia sp.]|nr:hypothetical protein [Nevskia sp.]